MNILVTGASGFVGLNLVPFLADRGFNIDTLVRSNGAIEGSAKRHRWSDLNKINFASFDAIIHLAGKAHDVHGVADESEYFEINVERTETLAQHSRKNGFCGKFIHMSSVKAVADRVAGILDESFVPEPKTVYGRSKLECEMRLAEVFSSDPSKLFILRPCMIHGPGNKGNLNLLYEFVNRGIPYPLAAFENERSLLGIGNLCHVMHQIVLGRVEGGTYHLADSGTISTAEIISVIADVSEKPIRKWCVPKPLIRFAAALGDWLPSPLDSDKLQKMTESYRVSNAKIVSQLEEPMPYSLKEGLARTITSFS